VLCALKLSIRIVVGSMPDILRWILPESESLESPKQRHRWSLFCSVRVREVYGFLLAAHSTYTSTLPSAKPICSYRLR